MINLKNYEEFALDYLEGNLSAEQLERFESFLESQPEIKAEVLALTNMVIATPNEEIVFENKDSLLKKEGGARVIAFNARFWYRATAIAAAVGLVFIGYFLGYKTGVSEPFNGQIVKETQKENPIKSENNNFDKKETYVIDDSPVKENTPNIDSEIENKKEIKKEGNPPLNKKSIIPEEAVAKSENIILKKEIEQTILDNNLEENKIEEIAVSTIGKTKITPFLLPQKSLDLFKTSFDNQMQNQAIYLSEMYLMNQNTEGYLVKTPIPEKGSRIRDLLGRLPFEGVTKEAFIPSYFTESD